MMEYPQHSIELFSITGVEKVAEQSINIAIKKYSQMVKEEIEKLNSELQEQGIIRHKSALERNQDVI